MSAQSLCPNLLRNFQVMFKSLSQSLWPNLIGCSPSPPNPLRKLHLMFTSPSQSLLHKPSRSATLNIKTSNITPHSFPLNPPDPTGPASWCPHDFSGMLRVMSEFQKAAAHPQVHAQLHLPYCPGTKASTTSSRVRVLNASLINSLFVVRYVRSGYICIFLDDRVQRKNKRK